MRIAFIVNKFPVLSETFIVNQAVGLIERGHHVDIFATQVGDSSKVHPLVEQYSLLERTYYLPLVPENMFQRVFHATSFIPNYFKKAPKATLDSINIIKHGKTALSLRPLYSLVVPPLKQSYDIVHCQFGTASFQGMFFRAINSPNAKLVTTFRGHDISSFVSKKGIHVYNELFESGDLFLANCDFFRNKLVEVGCSPSEVKVLRSGLDCTRFQFSPRYFTSGDKIRIATTGRLVEKKGIEYSIRAVASLSINYPEIKYNIIGDGPLRDQFQRLIEELKINHIVKLVGWKNDKEIIKILDQSHIFVAPSVTGRDGNQDAPINVLKEAMALGLPVVSTHHGGIPELVEDGISGFLVPECDIDALAQKLEYLINHPTVWPKMGQAGRDYVEKHYNLQQLNDYLVEVYEQLLGLDKPNDDLPENLAKVLHSPKTN